MSMNVCECDILKLLQNEKPALNSFMVVKPHNDMDGDAGSFLLPLSFIGTNSARMPNRGLHYGYAKRSPQWFSVGFKTMIRI